MRRFILASIVLVWSSTAFSGECSQTDLLKRAGYDAYSIASGRYSTAVAQYGEGSYQAVQAYNQWTAVSRCAGPSCSTEDEKITLEIAQRYYYDRSMDERMRLGEPGLSESERARLHASSGQYYALTVAMSKCLAGLSWKSEDGSRASLPDGPTPGYSGKIHNLCRGSGKPDDGGIWFRDRYLRWYHYGETGHVWYWDRGSSNPNVQCEAGPARTAPVQEPVEHWPPNRN